ncbi:hypothetical protein E1211_16365 [Micromonospora sp. 15K316]|uniref:hypothetical protein n=1 Tax=Micromonospora sp. 15K316 TaxID=2530376 RepID=UPI0010513A9D|nr:hypothetical protein [Micromonospora sp. 15K316]TDC35132.1 hypothetical protein E1211_16365 [Micromonospora sp. 15K316]
MIAIALGSVAVVCAISRVSCYYMGSYESTISQYKFDYHFRSGPGPVRAAPLLLAGLGLVILHAWPWLDGIDRHDTSLILSLVLCGACLPLMVTYLNVGLGSPFKLDDDGFWYGLATLLLGAGNTLIQLPFAGQQPSLSYWGLGVAILGMLIAVLAVAVDFKSQKIFFRWRMWRLVR